MIKLNVHEAKARLSEVLERVRGGESVVLCRRNRPVAEMRPLPKAPETPRPIGLAKGQVKVSPDFDAPLPDEVTDAFEGKSG